MPIGRIDLLEDIKTFIINPLLSFLIVLAFAYFVWGVVEFIRGASEPKSRENGQRHMIWGLVGIVIMLSALGILNLICSTIECAG